MIMHNYKTSPGLLLQRHFLSMQKQCKQSYFLLKCIIGISFRIFYRFLWITIKCFRFLSYGIVCRKYWNYVSNYVSMIKFIKVAIMCAIDFLIKSNYNKLYHDILLTYCIIICGNICLQSYLYYQQLRKNTIHLMN